MLSERVALCDVPPVVLNAVDMFAYPTLLVPYLQLEFSVVFTLRVTDAVVKLEPDAGEMPVMFGAVASAVAVAFVPVVCALPAASTPSM